MLPESGALDHFDASSTRATPSLSTPLEKLSILRLDDVAPNTNAPRNAENGPLQLPPDPVPSHIPQPPLLFAASFTSAAATKESSVAPGAKPVSILKAPASLSQKAPASAKGSSAARTAAKSTPAKTMPTRQPSRRLASKLRATDQSGSNPGSSDENDVNHSDDENDGTAEVIYTLEIRQ